jgi:hypothetical protein
VGNFVLPPSADGEWWELSDESRGGLPYYYQTKSGETVWERPAAAFIIPLGIIQVSSLSFRSVFQAPTAARILRSVAAYLRQHSIGFPSLCQMTLLVRRMLRYKNIDVHGHTRGR